MQPRYFLWFCIPQYMYRWGLSKAYIDILFVDDVITQYDTKKKSKITKEKDGTIYDPDGEKKVEDAMRKWYERHPELKPKRTVNLNELMGK